MRMSVVVSINVCSNLASCPHLFRLAGIIHPLQRFAHVLDLFPERGGNEDGLVLRGGEGEAIARARVEFDEFAAEFVLLLENDAGEIGGVLQVRDDDALDGDAEAFEDVLDEFVGEGTFGALILEIHGDDLASHAVGKNGLHSKEVYLIHDHLRLSNAFCLNAFLNAFDHVFPT